MDTNSKKIFSKLKLLNHTSILHKSILHTSILHKFLRIRVLSKFLLFFRPLEGAFWRDNVVDWGLDCFIKTKTVETNSFVIINVCLRGGLPTLFILSSLKQNHIVRKNKFRDSSQRRNELEQGKLQSHFTWVKFH